MTRRFSAPEVIQTSSMDCGPACLVSVLEGYGRPVDYERVRDLCQTDVDGTSIDVLEELAKDLGIEAEQIVLPVEHLLAPGSGTVPAILVVQQPGGPTHFVVVWRVVGPWVQVMDPGGGRRWTTRAALRRIAHRLTIDVGAGEWREWAGSPEAVRTLEGLLARRVGRPAARALVAEALDEPGPRSIAALDAALRLSSMLADGGTLRGRSATEALLRRAWTRARDEGPSESLPPPLWNVLPTEPDEDGEPQLSFRGVVLLRLGALGPAREDRLERVRGRGQPKGSNQRVAALRQLWGLVREHVSSFRLLGLVALIVAVAGTRTLVALLLSLLLDFDAYFAAPVEKVVGAGLLLLPVAAQVLLEAGVVAGTLQLGRELELRLRARVMARLRILDDDYVASRPRSDLAERLHALHLVRGYAGAFRLAIESGATLLGVVIALAVLSPSLGLVGLVAGVVTTITPLVFFSFIGERDMRLRALRGSLTIFDLDVLLGASVVRAHRAEHVLLDAQEERLTEWVRAGRGLMSAQTLLAVVVGVVGVGASVLLMWTTLGSELGPAGVMLVAYWGLLIPTQGLQLGETLLQQSSMLNVLLRISDLAGEGTDPVEPQPASVEPAEATGPMAIELDNCTILRGGHPVLTELSLSISPGEHVAVVGRSGAGKSTLASAIMGSASPESGSLRVDGEPAAALFERGPRADVVWIDPSVQLWNRTLLDNLGYGHHGPISARALGSALDASQVDEMLERLPGGLATALGEGGRCVSGGEGQRVRLGRALVRSPAPRLVVLDEAMRGLPASQRRVVLGTLRERWRDATVVCVTHDIETAATFPRVVVLEDGRIVEDGAPPRLREQPGSELAMLLEQEERVHAEVWGADRWRRLRLERGRLARVSDREAAS